MEFIGSLACAALAFVFPPLLELVSVYRPPSPVLPSSRPVYSPIYDDDDLNDDDDADDEPSADDKDDDNDDDDDEQGSNPNPNPNPNPNQESPRAPPLHGRGGNLSNHSSGLRPGMKDDLHDDHDHEDPDGNRFNVSNPAPDSPSRIVRERTRKRKEGRGGGGGWSRGGWLKRPPRQEGRRRTSLSWWEVVLDGWYVLFGVGLAVLGCYDATMRLVHHAHHGDPNR